MARDIKVTLTGDTKSLERAFSKAESSGSKFQTGMNKVGHGLGTVVKGAALAGVAVAGLGVVIGTKLVQDMASQQQMSVQTNTVIASTGKVAGVTRKHVEDLATAIQNKSGMDDQAIQSGENMLLTFTNIRNEAGKGNKIFDQSTKILADMSAAMGTDMKTQAIQLGKALNDPVKGVSALSEVGVTFTESQKKTIAAMVKTGNTAGAQRVILRELNKEFGGSATAAGQTLPGKLNILKGRLMDLGTSMASGIMPHLSRLVGFLTRIVAAPNMSVAVKVVWDGVKEFTGNVASALSDALFGSSHIVRVGHTQSKVVVDPGLIATMSTGITEAIKGVNWTEAGKAIAKGIGNATKGNSKEASWQATATTFYKDFIPALDSGAQSAARGIGKAVGTAIDAGLALAFKAVTTDPGAVLTGGIAIASLVQRAISFPMRTLQSFLKGVLQGSVVRAIEAIGPGAKKAASDVATIVAQGLKQIPGKLAGLGGDLVKKVVAAVNSVTNSAVNAAISLGSDIAKGVATGIATAPWDVAKSAFGFAIKGVIGAGKLAAKIKSPSQVTADEIGVPLAQGIIVGFLAGSRDLPDKVSEKVKSSLEAARNRIDSLRGDFSTSFGRLGSDAMSAFDAATAKGLAKIQARFDRLREIAKGPDQTPAEKLLSDLQSGHDAAGRAKALSDAQAGLANAQAGGDPQAIIDAQASLNEALYNEQVAALTQRAEAERAMQDRVSAAATASYDKQQTQAELDYQSKRDLQKRHLDDMLADLQANLDKHPKAWRKSHAKIMKIFSEEFGPDFATAGSALGTGFRDSLIEDFKVTGALLGNVGQAIKNALSPANQSAVSAAVAKANPKKMATGGIVTSPTYALIGEAGPEAVIPLSRMGAGGGGGNTFIFNGDVWDRQALVEDVRNALIRKGRNTTGGALGGLA